MTTALKLTRPSFPVLKPVEINPVDERALGMAKLFGWDELPDHMLELIESDLIGFHNEIKGLYCSRDKALLNRRASVRYWVENYLNGQCSYDTVVSMLRMNV